MSPSNLLCYYLRWVDLKFIGSSLSLSPSTTLKTMLLFQRTSQIILVSVKMIPLCHTFPSKDMINTLGPRQNDGHCPEDIFLAENVQILIKMSFKFVLKSSINNIPALVQIMAWRRQATSHYLNK